MVFWIALKSKTFYREIRTTCSTNTLLVGNLVGIFRQLLKFQSDKYFWISKFLWKHILPMKFRKPSKKLLVRKATTHTETKIRTWILLTLCLPYSFTVKAFFYSPFLLTWKFVESTCFLKQCNPIGDPSPREYYFPPSVIWRSLNTKISVKASSKRKKFYFFW